jgi:3-phytase
MNKTIYSFLLLCIFSCTNQRNNKILVNKVYAAMETEPVEYSGDSADDPCIWAHPNDPSLSLIIGTDKGKNSAGLRVYDLNGTEIFTTSNGKMNNVDIRYGFELGGDLIDIVTAGERTSNTLAVFKVDSENRSLVNIAAREISLGIPVYGSCMYKNVYTGDTYAIVNDKEGNVEQYLLKDNGQGLVDASLVRTLKLSSQLEGCVADDILGYLYIGEEDKGIWKFGANPNDSDIGILVDEVGENLTADVEGLTIYYSGDSTGYLIASSQGDNTYAIYKRSGENSYIGQFEIVDGNTIDGTSETDGIDVCNMNLGTNFSQGIFVVQDGINDVGNQNFKAVQWENISSSFNPPLDIYPSWDLRSN